MSDLHIIHFPRKNLHPFAISLGGSHPFPFVWLATQQFLNWGEKSGEIGEWGTWQYLN